MPDSEKAINLFDLRRIIGGVFTVLGVLLVILGLTESQEEVDRAAGVNINLWAGLGMLVVGLLFLLWAFTRPLSAQLDSEELGPPPGSDGERAVGGAEPGRQ
jgi:xanthine/uracil/vitamin C permease (AzgA family)